MTYWITSRRGTSKLLELVPNPFDDINNICSKQTKFFLNDLFVCVFFTDLFVYMCLNDLFVCMCFNVMHKNILIN